MKLKVRYAIRHKAHGWSRRTIPYLAASPCERGVIAEARLCYCCGKIIECSLPRGRVARELQVEGPLPEFDFGPNYGVVGSRERICEDCENVLKEGRNQFARPAVYVLRKGKYHLTVYGQKPGPGMFSDPLVRAFKKLKENT